MKKPVSSILLVEDDPGQTQLLSAFLSRLGYALQAVGSAEEALAMLQEECVDLILSDINLPGKSGIDLLADVRSCNVDIALVMMTAFSSIDQAVECMRRGADDYAVKPLHLADLQVRLERALDARASRTRMARLETQVRERHSFAQIVGHAPTMQRVFHVIERAAPTSATVLISGRTGTGKELVARTIHFQSRRAAGPFVDINCGALPEQLVSSELFGHQKGAFTGATETKKGLLETATGGSLFLDEVQSLKPDLQTMLLRALQERSIRRVGGRENIDIDVRIIAATNRDIREAVRRGDFREDLYYRLNVVNIVLPELRERREDIPLLIESFLKKLSPPATPCHFDSDAMRVLLSYPWPGNVRELENAVECAVAIGRPPVLSLADLPPHISGLGKQSDAAEGFAARTLDEIERLHILRVLEELGQHHSRAAEILGIDRRTLYRKLEKYKIEYNE